MKGCGAPKRLPLQEMISASVILLAEHSGQMILEKDLSTMEALEQPSSPPD